MIHTLSIYIRDSHDSGIPGNTHKTQCVHFPDLFFFVGWGGSFATPTDKYTHKTKCAHTSAKSWVHHCMIINICTHAPQVKWDVNFVIAYGHFNLLQGPDDDHFTSCKGSLQHLYNDKSVGLPFKIKKCSELAWDVAALTGFHCIASWPNSTLRNWKHIHSIIELWI